jgi:hypothetical protein
MVAKPSGTNAAAAISMKRPIAASTAVPQQQQQQQKKTVGKTLSLNEVIAKRRVLDDTQTVARLKKLLQQPAPGSDSKPQPPLSERTMHEYLGILALFAERLSDNWTGQPRHALPGYMEYVLRANGPLAAVQLLTDPAEQRRVAICMASVVKRCFPDLDPADKERAAASWRAVLSSARKQYLQARDAHGGFGGWVDESTLLPVQEIHAKLEQLPLGSADRCLLKLLQSLVPSFPQQYRVNSPFLNLGNIKLIAGDAAVAAAPTLEVVGKAERAM